MTTKQEKIKKVITFIPYLLSISVLIIFAFHIIKEADRYRVLLDFTVGEIISLFGLALCFPVLNGLSNLFLYRILGVNINLSESVGLAAVNTLANQLPLSGGIVAKAIYLKKRYQLQYSYFFSVTLSLYIIFLSTSGLIGLIVINSWWFFNSFERFPFLVIGFMLMTLSIVTLWLPTGWINRSGKFGQWLNQLADGWSVIGKHPRVLFILVGIQVMMIMIFAGRLWIAFNLLSQNITYLQCIFFSSASILTQIVSITPGGLGIREGIIAGLAAILGFDMGVSIVAVGIDRLIATTLVVVLGTIYTYLLSGKVLTTESMDSLKDEE